MYKCKVENEDFNPVSQSPVIYPLLEKKLFENIEGKGENAGIHELFLPFPTMFFTHPK